MDMIEKIARALCKSDGLPQDFVCLGCDDPMWMDYEKDAKVALECLKEPTDNMIHVGDLYGGGGAIIAYGYMIDAALQESQ